MATLTRIIRNCYRDSLSLMQLSARVAETPGVDTAAVVMATGGNLALLRDTGLWDGHTEARADDMLAVIRGDDNEAMERAFAALAEELHQDSVPSRPAAARTP